MSSTITIDEPTTSLSDLSAMYNSIKESSSKATDKLNHSLTLNGMDSVNELVAKAVKEIDAFTSAGKPKSMTSKAISVIDPKSKWAGKWLNSTKDQIKEENLKEQSINQIVDGLISKISNEREEVIKFIEAAAEIRHDMINSITSYESLLDNVNDLITKAQPNTREDIDAKFLSSQLVATITGLKADLKSTIEPLLASANISVQQIGAILPTIENDLKYKGSFKTFQQKLSDLNGMVTSVTELATNAGDAIRKEVNETIYESISMLSETGLDTDRLEKINQEELIHQQRLGKVMQETQDKINKNFTKINQIHLEHKASQQSASHQLLENYAEVKVND